MIVDSANAGALEPRWIAGLMRALYAWRLRRAIGGVRENMAALGFSIDNLTDEQVMEWTRGIEAAMRTCGGSVEQFADGAAALGKALSFPPPPARLRGAMDSQNYAVPLKVSRAAWEEVREKLRAAMPSAVIDDARGLLDMRGVLLQRDDDEIARTR